MTAWRETGAGVDSEMGGGTELSSELAVEEGAPKVALRASNEEGVEGEGDWARREGPLCASWAAAGTVRSCRRASAAKGRSAGRADMVLVNVKARKSEATQGSRRAKMSDQLAPVRLPKMVSHGCPRKVERRRSSGRDFTLVVDAQR